MLQKLFISIGFLLLSINVGYSLTTIPFDCVYEESTIIPSTGFYALFSASYNLSSHVSTDLSEYHSLTPGFQVRCRAENSNGRVKFSIEDKPTSATVCSGEKQEIIYFTGEDNARVAREYTSGFHSKVLCAEFAKADGVMHMVWNNQDLSSRNYECLFKTNDVKNGLVSSCDAEFDGTNQYIYTVWGILFDSIDSLNCRQDCTSKIDNRVYSICSAKIKSCSDVPLQCDGSLYGSWVRYNSTTELKCEAPWNEFRSNVFSNEAIEVTSEIDDCPNFIKIEYPVILEDEQVKMNVYVCDK